MADTLGKENKTTSAEHSQLLEQWKGQVGNWAQVYPVDESVLGLDGDFLPDSMPEN